MEAEEKNVIPISNKYKGEISITLYNKTYPMKINMNVIAAFQSETGKDYMHCAMKAMNALAKAELLPTFLAKAEKMTEAVSMEDAAWLFYLAAREMDSQVDFDEIQEAVLFEGPLMVKRDDVDEVMESYPVSFTKLVMFATLGVMDESKKQ